MATITARETLWAIKGRDDLAAWAGRLGVDTDGRDAWCVLDDCLRHDPVDSAAGMDAECVRMACRLAVLNADPAYRGYTPYGNI